MKRVHGPDFDPRGSIVQQIKGLDEVPEFADVVTLVDTSGDLSRFISELTETFAGIYLANPNGLIAFVHAVTAPSALRLLVPYLAEADARLAAHTPPGALAHPARGRQRDLDRPRRGRQGGALH